MCIYTSIYMGVVQNPFSRTALNRSANRVATAYHSEQSRKGLFFVDQIIYIKYKLCIYNEP